MDVKSLNLDRMRIQEAIDEFFHDSNTKMFERKPLMWEIRRRIDDGDMILQFYYIKDGRTTINYAIGKKQDISKMLAEHIIEKTLVDPRKNIYLAFKSFPQKSLDETMAYLSDVRGVKLIEDRTDDAGHRILKYLGQQDDTVTLTYHSNSTLQLQGRPVTLYCQIIAFLSEYLSLGDIIESQSKFIPIPIKISDIEYELDSRMPSAFHKIDQTLRKMLITSVAFTKLDISIPDYTPFAFPALRALEGFLKSLFFIKGITINSKDGFGPYFEYKSSRHVLKLEWRRKIRSSDICTSIEDCYDYYHSHRHSLFHAEVVPAGSTIIENRENAVKIIDDVITIIDKSFRTTP